MSKTKKKQEENPLLERMKILEKNKRKHGYIYNGQEDAAEKKTKKKKKQKKPQWDYLYNVTLMHFQLHLYELICVINSIPVGIYIQSSRKRVELIQNMKLNDEFKTYSKLDWDTPYPINGLYFRGRFATCVIFEIIKRSHKIVKSILEEGREGNLTKSETKQLQHRILDSWITIVDTFVAEYIRKDGDYVKPLRKIEELLGVSGDNDPEIRYYVEETDELLRRRDEAGIEVNNITKVAYALATGSLNTKRCPEYNQDFMYSDDRDSAEQVGQLGFAILKYRRKHEKLPVLYKAFQKANPKIQSRFYMMNEGAPEITVGVKALEFSKIFYGNYSRVDKLM